MVFVVDNSEKVDGLKDVGVALLRAYNYVKEEEDQNEKSLQFIFEVHACVFVVVVRLRVKSTKL